MLSTLMHALVQNANVDPKDPSVYDSCFIAVRTTFMLTPSPSAISLNVGSVVPIG